jgi:hypothetical protein
MFDKKKFWGKWHILIKILPLLILVMALKFGTHTLSLEILSLSALFTSIVAATTFLIGFLITGVISDYKESEKIPGDLAASIEALHDEAQIIYINKKSKEAKDYIEYHRSFLSSVEKWFYRKERTKALLENVAGMNEHFAKLETQAQATFINRMKLEQNNIRKTIIRVDNIRDLNFVASAYAIVEALVFFLILGLLLLKQEPFYESMFLSGVVSFMVLYMLFLIRDLDNPFDYSTYGESGTEVSLKPIRDLRERLYPGAK